MSMAALVINILAGGTLIFALTKNRRKTLTALGMALKLGRSLLPMFILIILLIGLLFSFVDEQTLRSFLGDRSGPLGLFITGLIGSVLHIPSIFAFPLSASLIERGASVQIAAAFITTLTMIGFVTLPLEISEMGRRFTLLRNGLSFFAALAIAALMGVIL